MLADLPNRSPQSGMLAAGVQMPAASLEAIFDFVTDQLPVWRDRPDRPHERSETALTAQLCAHLNGVARHADGWDVLQFRTELPDELQKGRKIDLAPTPCGTTLCIEGRNYSEFDTVLPIECKRLPTPKESGRDEREYVVHRTGTTGGIQRFKDGHHAASHRLAGMIAFVQTEALSSWEIKVAEWILELAQDGEAGWSTEDLLHPSRQNVGQTIALFRSTHQRTKGLPQIELRHCWIDIPSGAA